MPSRREALLTAGPLLSSTLAGCLDTFRTSGSLQEVQVELHNGNGEPHTFHLALELESEIMEWESYSVDTETAKSVVMTPPEDSSPVALHGAVDDFAADVEFLGVDNIDEDYCLHTSFYYRLDDGDRTQLAQSADIRC
ncbi:uncharacterized protein Nmag_3316 [Natrialba magadii ATCC 43099]|uniref:Lipoprotein n=1 Tax=Natrialba magadii (strain ATCC 43099 / DSM 3394 / CCM 3739 / CIP 104546 / IAM 13178 / JCM 8861 / NBRC 102185 / NCIMB 2190 / MS3) TaxID=547559 RepID=D3SSM1_NATMM|nr:hypothetical protein [Natrialba magadii]ADD06866.1 uncharacterized protein Nmag_3316 [Natrialba magadii ATCC 43099]